MQTFIYASTPGAPEAAAAAAAAAATAAGGGAQRAGASPHARVPGRAAALAAAPALGDCRF